MSNLCVDIDECEAHRNLCGTEQICVRLEESRPIFELKNNLKCKLKSFITNVSAALVPLRASKRMRTTSINKQIERKYTFFLHTRVEHI